MNSWMTSRRLDRRVPGAVVVDLEGDPSLVRDVPNQAQESRPRRKYRQKRTVEKFWYDDDDNNHPTKIDYCYMYLFLPSFSPSLLRLRVRNALAGCLTEDAESSFWSSTPTSLQCVTRQFVSLQSYTSSAIPASTACLLPPQNFQIPCILLLRNMAHQLSTDTTA